MKACQEAGIPWFSYDTKMEGDDAYYGWNNYDLGYAIGENAAAWVNENFGEGDVVYAASNNMPTAAFLVTREQGYKDALDENDVVLLHDDLLATGGTMKAACELVKKLKPKKVYINFIIELKDLNGKSVFGDDVEVESVLTL